MNDLLPYLGITLVILVVTVSITYLARRGFRLKKFKHDKTEIEFETSSPKQEAGPQTPEVTQQHPKYPSLTESMIQLTDAATRDCENLKISLEQPVSFILDEARRHPILFNTKFTSLPLVFSQNVLLLSWDESESTIERILNRQEAYPLNDIWSSCLALYRQATLLPYRTKGPEYLHVSSEAQRALVVYRRLISKVKEFLRLLRQNNQEPPGLYQDLSPLIEEAELALTSDDIGTSVARMEAVLSTIHKLILQCAPQGALTATLSDTISEELSIPDSGKATVLVVDDERNVCELLRQILEESGFAVTTASTSSAALRAMVEHAFDLVITDLVMPGTDGREVALAAKNSSPKTKVVVITGHTKMSGLANLLKSGVDGLLIKPFIIENLIMEIENVFKQGSSTSKSGE